MLCTRSVSWDGVSVSDKPAHVEAEGEEAGPQQVAQSGQVGDGEVVRVHAAAPHPVDHPVRHIEEDHHLNEAAAAGKSQQIYIDQKSSFRRQYLQQRSSQVEANEDGRQGGVAPPQGADGVEEYEVSWSNQQEKHTG